MNIETKVYENYFSKLEVCSRETDFANLFEIFPVCVLCACLSGGVNRCNAFVRLSSGKNKRVSLLMAYQRYSKHGIILLSKGDDRPDTTQLEN